MSRTSAGRIGVKGSGHGWVRDVEVGAAGRGLASRMDGGPRTRALLELVARD